MQECTVHNHLLKLNGSGPRKVFMVEVYKAYLFSKQCVRRRDQIVQEEFPYRISIQFSYGPISVERMRQAWKEVMLKNVTEDQFKSEEQSFQRFFDSIKEYQKADLVHYDLYRNEVAVHTNGELLCTIASRLLAETVVDVLVGERAIDETLKKNLLAAA
jgi:hypothetical protein